MNIEPTKNRREDETPIYTYIGERRLINEFFDVPVPLKINLNDEVEVDVTDVTAVPPICIESTHQSDRGDATPIRNCTWEGAQSDQERDDPQIRLGDWLVQRGVIDRHQLYVALNHAHANATRIGDAVVTLGFAERGHVEEEVLALFVFSALQTI